MDPLRSAHRWHAHPAVRSGTELPRQERIADAITRFAGSMNFVYLHAIGFAVWLIFCEKAPWQVLTMVVSLEAIFLSTFVMISQNSADRRRAELAMHDHQLLTAIAEHIGIDPIPAP
jgi:uncharacterized membrane protein